VTSARQTIAIARDLCRREGLPPEPFLARLTGGFERYGAENHLRPDFDVAGEWEAELLDGVAFAAIAEARAAVDAQDPNYRACVRHMSAAYKRFNETFELPPGQLPDRPLRIFVSGPYSADSPDGVAENVRRAAEAGQELLRRGHLPFVPHCMTDGWEHAPDLAYDDFLQLCLRWLPSCDAVYLLRHWTDSPGATREVEEARRLALFVFERLAEVPDLSGRAL